MRLGEITGNVHGEILGKPIISQEKIVYNEYEGREGSEEAFG